MTGWAFVAIGTPAAQGNHRTSRNGGIYDSNKNLRPWRDSVTAAAFGAGPKLEGPLAVRMIFTLPRPKSTPKKVVLPAKKPDLGKLARAVEDAITDAGLWHDDAQVVQYAALCKVWPGSTGSLPVPGVAVSAVELDGALGWTGVHLNQAMLKVNAAAWAKHTGAAA